MSAYVPLERPLLNGPPVGIQDGRSNSDDVSAVEKDWGVVIPLRRLDAGPTQSSIGPISPELVLVDPELARIARAHLPDFPPRVVPARPEPTPAEVVPPPLTKQPRSGIEYVVVAAPDSPRRRLRLLGSLAGAGAIALIAFLVWQQLPSAEPRTTAASSPARTPATTPLPSTPEATTPAPDPEPAPSPPTTTPSATAPTPPGDAPPRGQTFVWVATPAAAAYEFQLFRGSERIYRARVTTPRLDLPARWSQSGRRHELAPGSYRWYVWPVLRRTGRQSDVATVQARLVVEEQAP